MALIQKVNQKDAPLRYRAEIDGLRAIAVVPVILFHAGFGFVSGGFVGVDVFFVISGYLITSIILSDLQKGRFSIVDFYERRARRILPALFLIMGICSVFAYAWMLPDELENFGQSILATALFSNNILLGLTSGYWSLASEFKPLLHTWSLAAEEQFYVLFPLLLMAGWRYFKKKITWLLLGVFILSLGAAHWGSAHKPDLAFYLLPTRAWELLIGSFAAFHVNATKSQADVQEPLRRQILSMLGLSMILGAVFFFDSSTPSPSLYTLIPTLGAVLLILHAQEGTAVHRILSHRWMVGIGLISYSAYLWHHPLFSFARIYAIEAPPLSTMAGLSVLTFILATVSWRYIETPFRKHQTFNRQFIFSASAALSLSFVAYGYFLHTSHGVPSRMYDTSIASSNDMYISYNERAFKYKKDEFKEGQRLNLLIVGNSYARDFVNMTLENFDLKGIELVYRNDSPNCLQDGSGVFSTLYKKSDVIVFASGEASVQCTKSNIAQGKADGKDVFYVGTKHFGHNLNWLARLEAKDLPNRTNPLIQSTKDTENSLAAIVPKENFISLLSPIVKDGLIPVTDAQGRLLSADRSHLTKHGAMYIGESALVDSNYGEVLRSKQGVRHGQLISRANGLTHQ